MAERVYGDVAATEPERNAATLARWIIAARPAELHLRHLQTQVRLPGRRTAEQIRAAAELLVEADWLRAPAPATALGRHGRIAYAVNPRLWEARLWQGGPVGHRAKASPRQLADTLVRKPL